LEGLGYAVTVKVPVARAVDVSVLMPSKLTPSLPTAMLNDQEKVSPIMSDVSANDSAMLLAADPPRIVRTGVVAVRVSPKLPVAVIVAWTKIVLVPGFAIPNLNMRRGEGDCPGVDELVYLWGCDNV